MTQTIEPEVGALRASVAGQVLSTGDEGYDSSRSLFNGEFDRRPAVVVRPAGPADVAVALAYAREHGLEVTVRGGGHATAGTAAKDGALMIDLGSLRTVSVDPVARLARAGGGATLADLDTATQEHGLAVPAGKISDTGIGGLTLGGGMGWLTRRHGLTVDNLESAEVVLADGRCVRASATEHPDLFWALRGGGGNFGVVTEFEYRLHEVGPVVEVGMFFYDLDRTADVLRLDRELSAALSRELTILVSGVNAPPAPFLPPALHFRPVVALMAVGYGGAAQHAELLGRIRDAVPSLSEFVTPMPYVALQQMLDQAAPWGVHVYEKALYLDDLTDDVVAAVEEHLPRKTSPLSLLHFYALGGAYGDVADDATAFGGSRTARYGVFVIGITTEPAALDAERAWVRATWDALRPFAADVGGYVNGLTEWDGAERVRAVYGAKYPRLAEIKAAYDPTNVFRANANITPA
jgi:FAD/FMN-containing dehydrogenase